MQREIEKLDLKFEPSMKILARIVRVILEKNSIRKTGLSQEANIQYTIYFGSHVNPQAGLTFYDGKMKLLVSASH